MSVKVNLLPREIEVRSRGRRVAWITGFAVLLFAGVLAAVYLYQLGEVRQAEDDRDAAQERVEALAARRAELQEFADLRDELERRRELLASAMAAEISWARILNDFALAFPSDASMLSLDAQAVPPEELAEEPEPGEVAIGLGRVGQMSANGYSIAELSPGVETVLIDFEGAQGFFNSYLQTAAVNEIADTEITEFNGTIDLDEDAFTFRYLEGLPPEVQP